MNISEPFIKRPVATALLMAGVIMMGLLGYSLLPISALPAVDFPTIQVTAQFPGASPDVMTSTVTTPLERQFGQISGLTMMTSISSFANTAITLQFALDRDIDAAAQDVQAAINAAGGVLPKTMPNPPTYSKVNPSDQPILTIALTSDALPLEKVNDLADTLLAQKLSEVTGVGLVTIEGNQKPAVRVRIDPAAIASLGLGLEDVRAALTQNNLNQPKGSFDGARQSYAIGANDQILTAAAYRDIVIAYRNGAPVRLGDLGEVIDNVENVRLAAWVGQQPAVVLDIQRQPGANIIETVDRVKALLPKLRAALPPSVKAEILTDRTETIRASVKDVQFTLLLTVALVVMVIFLFLRKLWATVIPSVALPLAIIGTFGVLKPVGFSLDNLSLMALTIATGFVVDDAIVMIENIVRYIEKGDTPMEAALKGSKQIGFTVISLTVSLIAVFIPLLFMTGIVGRLFREFAITLSVAVAMSAIVSLTLTPMMCARLLKRERPEEHGRFFQFTERGWQAMLHAYDAGLKWVLRHQFFTLTVAVATLVATVWLYVIVPKGLLPQQDTGLIVGVTDSAQSISFKAMMERQRAVAEIVRQDPDVVNVSSFVGAGTVNATVNTGRLYIALKPRDRRTASASAIIDRLRDATRNVEGIYIVLGVLYESYIHPITILSSLPSAGVGALLALMICRTDLSLIALIGIVLLIGIVKKNAIMMIDFALDAERNDHLPPEQSIYQACLLRFRPIMMTTFAALFGALPLALQNGTGSELRKPMGIAIVGGLLLSQFITLYTTPVIYLYMDRLGKWVRRKRSDADLPAPGEIETQPALSEEPETVP